MNEKSGPGSGRGTSYRSGYMCSQCGATDGIVHKPGFDGHEFDGERRVHVHQDGTEWRATSWEEMQGKVEEARGRVECGEPSLQQAPKPRRSIARFHITSKDQIVALDDRGELWEYFPERHMLFDYEKWVRFPPLPPDEVK